ncbi:MAG: ThiF family adenylyltransferase [Ginsengibacter sp.]
MVHWFKRHPQHLAAESTALSTSKNYKELYQVRNNLLISHGYILVRLEKTHRFPLLIVYPEATPYVLPAIYPLREELTKAQVESLAKGTTGQIYSAISGQIKYYYHLRHQNQSGVLCILEWDNLDDGSKFYGIASILKRVRDWFKGTITGEFPPDSQEVEFHAHFVNVADDLKLLYPDKFLDEKLVEGEAYSLLLSYLPKNKYRSHERKAFFGCLLTGISKAGLIEHVEYDLPNFFFDEGIRSPIDLIEKAGVVKRLINEGRLLRSPWFQLQNEPAPFESFTELILLIGEGDYDAGVRRMLPYFTEGQQKEKPESFFVSVRFPNRKSQQEFQLFRVWKKTEPTGYLFCQTPEDALRYFLDSYGKVEAVRCEKFTEETYHLRNAGRAERNLLKVKTVNVVGVGALGSEIADSLGKAGVGTLCLFDNQLMRGPNPVRHLAGLDQMDLPKVTAVAQILANHNPFIQVHMNGEDLNNIDLNDHFADGSISISSMAEDNTEGFLNERAVISHRVVYYARALRGGKAARIFRVIPGKDACFRCLELYRNEEREIVIVPEDEELPTLKNECNNPVRPASAADLKLISALASRILLDEMQKGFGTTNHWIWSTEEVAGLQPFQLHAHSIDPHPKCCYCNHEKKVKVILPNSILKQMQDLVAENPRVETGGVLAGYTDESGDIVITNAFGPGPKAIRVPTKFEKDVEYCQAFLDDLFTSSNKRIVYVGEWHSHPSPRNQPSGTDIKSLTEIAFQRDYLTDMPAMIIFSNTGVPSCTIHPAGKAYYFTDLIEKV